MYTSYHRVPSVYSLGGKWSWNIYSVPILSWAAFMTLCFSLFQYFWSMWAWACFSIRPLDTRHNQLAFRVYKGHTCSYTLEVRYLNHPDSVTMYQKRFFHLVYWIPGVPHLVQRRDFYGISREPSPWYTHVLGTPQQQLLQIPWTLEGINQS